MLNFLVLEKMAFAVVVVEVTRDCILYDLCIEVDEIMFHSTLFCLRYELRPKKQVSI